MKTKPTNRQEIWLQVGENQEDEDRTWSEDKINDTDIKYIRADLQTKNAEERVREHTIAGAKYLKRIVDCKLGDFCSAHQTHNISIYLNDLLLNKHKETK